MLKHRTKNELLEIAYKLEGEKNDMIDCFEKQTKVLKEISKAINPNVNIFIKIINFFVSPFLLAAVLKENKEYFYLTKNKQMKKLTEKGFLEAYKKIAQYEKKDGITPLAYKDYFSKVLQMKGICDTCGDIMQRLHNDFQKRINKEAKRAFPYLIKPITFKSAKYSSNGFNKLVPMMCFADLEATKLAIFKDIKGLAGRGLKGQVKLLEEDMLEMVLYIDQKTNGLPWMQEETVSEVLDRTIKKLEKPEATPLDESEQSEAFEESESEESGVKGFIEEFGEVAAIDVLMKVMPESLKKPKGLQATTELIDTVVDAIAESIPEKPEYSNEIAIGMKEKGLSNEEIGDYFGVSETTIRRRVKKFEDEK
jgi:DNA-binding Lrp family transcriptional regulator